MGDVIFLFLFDSHCSQNKQALTFPETDLSWSILFLVGLHVDHRQRCTSSVLSSLFVDNNCIRRTQMQMFLTAMSAQTHLAPIQAGHRPARGVATVTPGQLSLLPRPATNLKEGLTTGGLWPSPNKWHHCVNEVK